MIVLLSKNGRWNVLAETSSINSNNDPVVQRQTVPLLMLADVFEPRSQLLVCHRFSTCEHSYSLFAMVLVLSIHDRIVSKIYIHANDYAKREVGDAKGRLNYTKVQTKKYHSQIHFDPGRREPGDTMKTFESATSQVRNVCFLCFDS